MSEHVCVGCESVILDEGEGLYCEACIAERRHEAEIARLEERVRELARELAFQDARYAGLSRQYSELQGEVPRLQAVAEAALNANDFRVFEVEGGRGDCWCFTCQAKLAVLEALRAVGMCGQEKKP